MSGTTIPIVMTAQGAQPQTPASLLAQLLAAVTAVNPGYTATLPGSLIEDISSTDVAAIALCDSAWVELINSVTPYGANEFLLNQLGQVYGVPQGVGANTSVYLVFSGTPGFVITPGFTVSDGTNQYVVTDGGVVGTSGTSPLIFASATTAGSFAVPANTVTTLITSVPGPVTLSVTNPSAGTPSSGPQSIEDYRAQVLQAGYAVAQGLPTFLKTIVGNVAGVDARLVSVRQLTNGWEVIVGGTGDPIQIAYAIYASAPDLYVFQGSTLLATAITNSNPGTVTVDLNHGYATGQVVQVNGATGMPSINATPFTITVLNQTQFTIGVDTTSYGTYTGNGVVTPNFRNVTGNVYDYPDTYTIPFVVPPMQSVTVTLTWNTTATFSVSSANVATLGQVAIAGYINAIPVGQPINLFELQNAFQVAVASVLPVSLLTRMVFSVYINGVLTSPSAGTGIIAGDPESYFETTTASITITQG